MNVAVISVIYLTASFVHSVRCGEHLVASFVLISKIRLGSQPFVNSFHR